MQCNCRWTEIILAIVIVIFSLVKTAASKWLLFAAGIILFLHALICKNCGTSCMPEKKPVAKKKKK